MRRLDHGRDFERPRKTYRGRAMKQAAAETARAPASGPRPLAGALAVGVDLGKVTTAMAVGRIAADGSANVVETIVERHSGEPLRPFVELYRRLLAGDGTWAAGAPDGTGPALDGAGPAVVVATGAYSDRLGPPVVAGVPEEIAQEHAARALFGDEGALNVVRIGGSGYSVLTRTASGRVRYEPNERCSAGTGETIEGLCSRLGSTLERAVQLAQASPDAIVVTSRCAVFAKSELTHYANEGEDHGRIFRGVFESVARNVHALYDKVKVDGPVVAVGNGALIGPVVEAFSRLAGVPVIVPPEAGYFEALGALRFGVGHIAAGDGDRAVTRDRDGEGGVPDWPAEPESLIRRSPRRIRALTPAAEGGGSVVWLDNRPASSSAAGARRRRASAAARPIGPVVLGLDLGSTGSKAVFLAPQTGEPLSDVYRRTEGNPVEAAKALVAELLVRSPLDVAAIGVTGSGRDAVATVLRAAYPDLGPRLTVLNEIVAHAAAAARVDPGGGASLSIVEIGGQDSKFINVRDGRVIESDMNRVCSAGTGSFLEEQAIAFGLDDIAQFGEFAARSERPPDLGQTCTVFVADVAAEALAEGFSRDDIFAGLQYSVIRNYKGRVMGDRRFLEHVFFQGKPASNPSLARTLAAVTEREVVVPENPGAMGAIGIALLASEAAGLGKEAGNGGRGTSVVLARGDAANARGDAANVAGGPIDLGLFLSARVAERREFRCGDRQCSNFCRLEAATIEVHGDKRKIVSGGTCPKYDAVSEGGVKLPKDAPNAFREREELLEETLREAGESAPAAEPELALRIAVPQTHYLIDFMPFFATFFARLGHEVEVLKPSDQALADGDRRCTAAGACAPVKMAHGLVTSAADVIFNAEVRPRALPQRRQRHVHVSAGAGHAGAGRQRLARGSQRGARAASGVPAQGRGGPEVGGLRARAAAHGAAARARRVACPPRAALLARLPRRARGSAPLREPPARDRRAFARLCTRAGVSRGAHGRRDARRARSRAQLGDPRPGGGQRRSAGAGRLLPGAGLGAAAGPRALGQREQHAALRGRRGRGRRCLSAAARCLRVRSQLVRRAPLQRRARRLPAHRARERRARRQGRLRDARAGVPARGALVSRGAERGGADAWAARAVCGGAGSTVARAADGRAAGAGSAGRRSCPPRALRHPRAAQPVRQRASQDVLRQRGRRARPPAGGGDARRRARRGVRRRHRRRGPAEGARRLLGQGVSALPAHLGDAGALPRGARAGARRQRLASRARPRPRWLRC